MRQHLLSLLITALLPACALSQPAQEEVLRNAILEHVTGAASPSDEVMLSKFGGRGDSLTDCRPAFVKAIRYARKHGGARVVLTKGVWLCKGPVALESHVTLDIREGAVLKFVADPKAFLPMVETGWEGTLLWNYSPFIYGMGLTDVAVVGRGTIDGDAGETFSLWHDLQGSSQQLSHQYNHAGTPVSERRFGEGHFLRPPLIQLYDCERVTLSGVFICRSPFWCVHVLKCRNVVLRDLRYDAKLVNNDGIDIESSRDVLIEDIHFDNGDDNIAIKSGRDNDGWNLLPPSENILIRRCHFKGLHAVVMGSEMSGGVQNVLVEDCDYSGYCKRGIFIKTNPDRGGFVRNIYVRNVRFGEVLDLFYVTSMYAGQGLDNHHFSEVSHIRVDSVSARKVNGTALVLQGTTAKPISDISFSRIYVGETLNGVSFENTEPVSIVDTHLGPAVGVPSQVSAKDKIFEQNNK